MSQEQGGFAPDGARTVQGFRIFAYFSFVSSTTMTSIGWSPLFTSACRRFGRFAGNQ